VKEQKSPLREILLLPKRRRGVAVLKRRGNSDLCGGRLKKLFEKSFSLLAGSESFKNFSAAIVFSFY
jgi:hypothetical protein